MVQTGLRQTDGDGAMCLTCSQILLGIAEVKCGVSWNSLHLNKDVFMLLLVGVARWQQDRQ